MQWTLMKYVFLRMYNQRLKLHVENTENVCGCVTWPLDLFKLNTRACKNKCWALQYDTRHFYCFLFLTLLTFFYCFGVFVYDFKIQIIWYISQSLHHLKKTIGDFTKVCKQDASVDLWNVQKHFGMCDIWGFSGIGS